MNDPVALIADFTEPEALTSQPGFCDQVLLLTPRRGVLITTNGKEAWEQLLTHQAENTEHPQALRLSWRR
eukprot:10273157-Lingulodinium_polyedra.AAC.1